MFRRLKRCLIELKLSEPRLSELRLNALSLSALTLLLTCVATDQSVHAQSKSMVNRYLTEHTIAGAKVDLDRVDLNAVKDKAIEWGILDEELDRPTLRSLPFARAFISGLVDAGAEDCWLFVDLLNPTEMQTVILTVQEGPDQEARAEALLETLSLLIPPNDQMVIQPKGNHVLICSKAAAARFENSNDDAVRKLPSTVIEDQQQVLTGFFIPSADQKRAMAETLPVDLPAPFDSVNLRLLSKQVEFATMRISLSPEIKITANVKSESAGAAEIAKSELEKFARSAAESSELKEMFPQAAKLVASLPMNVRDDSVRMELTESNGEVANVINALAAPVKAARMSASRQQSMNNMKQLMLAFHNYYSVQSGFPLRANVDANNQPLLSWRVQLLPFIEQGELYKQFHLDEPWDSDHNKTLIEKMPVLFRSPGTPNLKPGLTNYVVPIAEATFLSTDKPMTFGEITDGSSNTLAILETDADHAVIWTKPDDLDVDFNRPKQGLLIWSEKVFLGGLMDGSVQALTVELDNETVKHLMQYNDGNVVRF